MPDMILCMSTRERVTVTLPPELLATAKAAAGGNLSAYVERAIRAQALREAAEAVTRWRGDASSDMEEIADIFGEDVA
jgi:post-segregation antitoxin (ccd killing protein)